MGEGLDAEGVGAAGWLDAVEGIEVCDGSGCEPTGGVRGTSGEGVGLNRGTPPWDAHID